MLAVAIAAVCLVATLGGGQSIQATLLSAVNSSFSNKTADVTMTMRMTADGQSITMNGAGEIDFATNAMKLDANIGAAGESEAFDVVYVGGTVYEKISQIGELYPGKNWLSITSSDLKNLSGQESSQNLGESENPTSMLKLLKAQGKVTSLGPSTIDGVSVQGYSFVVTPAQIRLGLATGSIPSSLRSQIADFDSKPISYTVYVDGKGLLRQESFTLRMSIASVSISAAYTMRFSNYGTADTVSAPPQNQVVSFQQFLNEIGSALNSNGNSNSSSSSGSSASTTSCEQSPPAGASQQAVEYLNAVNAGDAGWSQVTQIIDDNNGQYNLQALEVELQTDKQELKQVQAIDFTGSSAAIAEQFESALSSYIADVQTAASSSDLGDASLQTAMGNESGLRSDASSALRQSLGLPQSNCSFLRPGGS